MLHQAYRVREYFVSMIEICPVALAMFYSLILCLFGPNNPNFIQWDLLLTKLISKNFDLASFTGKFHHASAVCGLQTCHHHHSVPTIEVGLLSLFLLTFVLIQKKIPRICFHIYGFGQCCLTFQVILLSLFSLSPQTHWQCRQQQLSLQDYCIGKAP